MSINNQEVQVKEYQGQRVVTFKDIDQCHSRPEGTARKRFIDNKKHFVEGVDYFEVQKSEKRTLGFDVPNRGLTLLTESGYLMLVKSFTDDLAWQVQRQLVNTYFKYDESTSGEYLKAQAQKERAEAMLLNAKSRMIKTLSQIGVNGQELSSVAKQTLGIKIVQEVIGVDLGDCLPQCEKTYSATEIGEMLGVSANKVGKLANSYGLKTPEYGIEVLDKSRSSNKEVPNFRYYLGAVKRFQEILGKKHEGKERKTCS